jgi:hypothetical protein
MAVVGDAYVVVRALTTGFKRQVERELAGLDGVGNRAGRRLGDGVRKGLGNKKISSGLSAQFLSEAEAARVKLRNLNIASFALIPALGGVLGALGAIGGGLVTLISVLGNASRSLIVLPAILGAVAQAAIALRLALKGVGEAFQAGIQAQDAAADSLKAQEAAARRLRDARLALKRLLEEEKPEALAEARERAVRAEEAAADALLSSERAQRTYNESQRRTLRALDNLNKARDNAREKIQQLRFELEGGAISEKKARLEFEKARDSLQRVQDLPPNSRARQEAELAFAEADLNLRKAIDRNSDLKKEEEAATRAGVEGSQEVVDAKQDIIDAQQAETDAGIEAAKAVRDAARARAEADQATADAAAGGRVEREFDRRIAAAREAVQDAEEAAREAAAGGYDAYRKALEKLSPEAQAFVKFLIAQQDAFKGLRAAAGRQLFPKLEQSLTIIIGKFEELEPLLEETGSILGDIAVDFAETFFQGENFDRLKSVWSTNNTLLGNLGTTVVNLLEGFLILLNAAKPLIDAFGDWAVNTSEAWKNTKLLQEQNGELAATFEGVQTKITILADTFGQLFDAFGAIGDVVNAPGGPGEQLLTYFKDAATSFNEFIQAGKEDGSLNTFLTNITTNFTKVLDLVGKIVGGILNLGASEGVGQFLDSLNNVADIFGDIGQNVSGEDGAIAQLGLFLEEFAILTKNLTDSGAIEVFFATLTGALKIANAILSNEIVQGFLKFLGFLFAISAAIGRVQAVLKFFGKAFAGIILKILGPTAGGALIAWFRVLPIRLISAAKSFGLLLVKFFTGTLLPFLGRMALLVLRFLGGPWGLLLQVVIITIGFIIKYWDEIVQFFKDTGEAIGKFFVDAWKFISDAFINAWRGISTWWNNTVVPFFTNLGPNIARAAGRAFDWFINLFRNAWAGVTNWWNNTVIPFFRNLPGNVARLAGAIWNFLGDFLRNAWTGVTNWWNNTVIPWFTGLPGRIANAAAGLWDFFRNGFRDALNFIIRRWNAFRIDARFPPDFIVPFLRNVGFTLETPNIPELAAGGVVKARPGGIAAIIGEGGRNERVEPLDKDGLSVRDRAIIAQLSGSGGATINVYPSAGMNERELADLVSRRLAFELRRGAA